MRLSGGAVYVTQQSTYKDSNGALFSGNVASSDGGAVFMDESSTYLVEASKFDSNVAGHFGGAIFVGNGCTFRDQYKNVFSKNSA